MCQIFITAMFFYDDAIFTAELSVRSHLALRTQTILFPHTFLVTDWIFVLS
jgi:hypothetical protein